MTIPHGSRTRYNAQRCRCTPCRAAHATYNREWGQGARRSVPAAPVHAHVRALMASGWTQAALARHTGYNLSTIKAIASGRSIRPRVETAEDILSVQPLDAVA